MSYKVYNPFFTFPFRFFRGFTNTPWSTLAMQNPLVSIFISRLSILLQPKLFGPSVRLRMLTCSHLWSTKRKIFIPTGRNIYPCKDKVFSLQVESNLLARREWVKTKQETTSRIMKVKSSKHAVYHSSNDSPIVHCMLNRRHKMPGAQREES